jgi:rsbT co-antagonist protein RsbR
MAGSRIPSVIKAHESEILEEWLSLQATVSRSALGGGEPPKAESANFLRLLAGALQTGNTADLTGSAWNDIREMLADLSRTRARQGHSSSQTAIFALSLKQPLFTRLRADIKDIETFGAEVEIATSVLDQLGLYITEVFQKSREEVITRQQQELLELSTPVTQLWDGILAVPLIGTLDSARTQVVMESLLEEIVRTGASIAVMDITGVPAVDTLVAQHLLKTVSAAKLMGAECIISGIRPQIAQTIVHLGVDLGDVVTKATLADAFEHALNRLGLQVTRTPEAGGSGR